LGSGSEGRQASTTAINGRSSMIGGRIGLNVAIENVGDVLFDRAPQRFHRVVPNQKQDVTLQYETEEDY